MPSRPARKPAITPAASSATMSSASSPAGRPKAMAIGSLLRRGQRTPGRLGDRDRLDERCEPGTVARRILAQVAPEHARPRLAMIEAEHMAHHVVEPSAGSQVALDVRDQT